MSRLLLPSLLLLAVPAFAQEPIQFARTPDLSPDGKLVAFSYLGDIWTVEAIGGVARPVTMHEAHDYAPVFSPDGRKIAFASNRHGSYDVFVVPMVGGKPKRLTFDSAADVPLGWTADGKAVIFASGRSVDYPGDLTLMRVPADGGAETKYTGYFEAKDLQFSPTGDKVAFVRGQGLWSRRGYRGASNDDIYLSKPDGGDTKPLTTHDGNDTAPMWSADGKRLFYVTENGSPVKCANIVVQEMNGLTPVGSPQVVTKHSDDFVRRARISRNGEWIVYECGPDLWVLSTAPNSSPRKMAIEVHADDKSNTERAVTYTRDATGYAVSPEERHAVLVVHGQLFLTKIPDGGKATRLTDHGGADSQPAWSPDSTKIVFVSDRSGTDELYLLEQDDPDHPSLTRAHTFKTTQLTNSKEGEQFPLFSPKGDKIAFLRAGQLWTMKPDGKEQKALVEDKKVTDYEWSPDGKWIAFSRMDGSFASEVYIVPVDGSAKPRNVSRYATFNSEITWGAGKLAFISQRRGSYGVYVLPLQKPASEGTKPDPNEIEWDDIHLRVEKPATLAVEGEAAISADGTQVAFRAVSNGDDLWAVSADGKSLNRLTSGNQSPRSIRWSKKGSGTIFFLNASGELRSTRTSFGGFGPSGPVGEPAKIPFQCKLSIRRDEEFNQMFAQGWRALADGFYDPNFNGVDWKAVREKYARIVPHCATREDLYAAMGLMLGELNSSHLGISGRLPVPDEQTADLGLIFDDTHPGPGLKVKEVLKRGPADKKGLQIKAGDIVTHIDRVELTPAVNVSKLLNNRAGEGVPLRVKDKPDATTKRDIEIVAADRGKVGQLFYERWVAANAEKVEKESGGKLGYIHIPSMDETGLEQFVRALYSDNFDKEGIVVDVRYNGGGFTHDQVLNYLTGKDHTRFEQRDGGTGFVARNYDRKWAKPLTLLINNRSFSDAEVFPHAVRAAGLGKLIGQATAGQVIFTGSIRLIDGSTFRMPRIGVYRNDAVNMDKEGVKPDVAVDISPDDWKTGRDPQLSKAVQVLTDDVKAWKAAKGGSLATTPPKPESKPTPTQEVKPDPKPDPTKPTGDKPPEAIKKMEE
ncbi:MAG: S41 family peptidase [Fimbriiglobus sp.]|nr:S41 family peptidase [Fimbriiglobus sp.]